MIPCLTLYNNEEASDNSNRVCVRFWDGFAMHFEKKYNEGNSNPRIITISSCKILKNQYTGELTIRNVQPTRLFVNFKTGKEDSIMKR